MAFVLDDLVTLAGAVSSDQFMRLHAYKTGDSEATVQTAGYFVTAGQGATASKMLNTGDLILCINSDKTTGCLYKVSDGDAGTVVDATIT